jgi:hypothetical protein
MLALCCVGNVLLPPAAARRDIEVALSACDGAGSAGCMALMIVGVEYVGGMRKSAFRDGKP